MKYLVLTILHVIIIATSSNCQVPDGQLNEVVGFVEEKVIADEARKVVINGIINDPELYNTLWKNFVDQAVAKDAEKKWQWLNDLNIQFKTFQTDDNPNASLGFTYDFNFDYANFKKHGQNRRSTKFSFSATGNVAFEAKLNPVDFLETRVNYSYANFIGGVATKSDTSVFTKLNEIEDSLVIQKDPRSARAMALWDEFGRYLTLSNQYYYAFSPKFSLESNQDFSQTQFTPGIAIDLGAKAWDNNGTLAKFNIFDYPFALIRYIVGTDKKFTVYGSTIPIVQLAFDYVLPSSDSVRNDLEGNLDPFPRIKIESGFRTFITRIKKENIFFNANFRYYREVSAPKVIENANLAESTYLVLALQTTSGFYVSYAKGKLPFDAKGDEIYALGFNFKFD